MLANQIDLSRLEQKPVFKYFMTEECKPCEIYRRICDVYGKVCF